MRTKECHISVLENNDSRQAPGAKLPEIVKQVVSARQGKKKMIRRQSQHYIARCWCDVSYDELDGSRSHDGHVTRPCDMPLRPCATRGAKRHPWETQATAAESSPAHPPSHACVDTLAPHVNNPDHTLTHTPDGSCHHKFTLLLASKGL